MITSSHAIEKKRVNIVEESLVIQEEFAKEAKIPAPRPLPATINLEEGNVIIAVDLVAGRVEEGALLAMPLKSASRIEIRKAKLADVDYVGFGIRYRIRGKIPWLDFVLAKGYFAEIPNPGYLCLILSQGSRGSELFDFLFAGILRGICCASLCRCSGVLNLNEVKLLILRLWCACLNFWR